MKHLATAALMLNLGVAVYAQSRPVKMTFSGTNVATTINLQPNTVTDEQHSAGNGTLGAFTFRELHADGPSTQPPSTCSGPYFPVVAGGGVFRFQDGSQLTVTITEGDGCINPMAGAALLTVKYQITGGTGRFEGASGALTYTATMRLVFRNASNAPALLTLTGEIEGTVSGAGVHLNPMSVPQIVTAASGPAVFHSDFSPVTAAKPAKAGEVLIVEATGLGPTVPGVDPGQPFPTRPLLPVNSRVAVTVNGSPAEVINAIGWPGLVDTYRIDFRVPDRTTAGMASIQITTAWIAGPDVRIAIQ
jgi:uncharacterized protein (TIGR03437 family)